MSNIISRGAYMCFILLSLNKNLSAQAPHQNLHTTVTQHADRHAITGHNHAETASGNTTAPENTMPQKQNYTDMNNALYVQSTVNGTLRKAHNDGIPTGLPSDFHYNMAQWTQRDVTEFAKCDVTFDTYEILLGIANTSVEKKQVKVKNKDGKMETKEMYTQDALEAQKALEAIKPACCNSWKGFARMIGDAAEASQSLRNEYRKAIEARKNVQKHGSVIDLKEFSNIAVVTDDKVQAIDPKTAFHAAGAVMSPEQAKFDEAANAALAKLKAQKDMVRAA